MANQTIKDIHKSPAQAVVDEEAKDVINYYTEERAALSYAPVMTADRGSNYPTQLMISADGETWSELPAKTATPVPLPRDLRPTADDWQPSCEVSPSSVGYDLGGFTATNLAPKKISVTWPSPITAYLCRLPYSPLASWPWRTWWGNASPSYMAAGVQRSPAGEEVIGIDETREQANCDVDYSKSTQPYIVGGAGGISIEDNGTPYPYALRYVCGEASFTLPVYNYSTLEVEKPTHTFDILFPMRVGVTTIYLMMFCRHTYDGKSKPLAAAPHAGEWTYSRLTWAQRYKIPIGFGLKTKFASFPSTMLCVFTITFADLACPEGATHVRFSLSEPPLGHNSLFFAGSYEQPAVNPLTNNYAPFVRTLRHDLLRNPANLAARGRLTDMTLPACAYDIVLHWWTEDGKSLALPFKAVAVERSAKVVAETKTDVIAADWLSAERTQYTTMRGETETRYRCAIDLDEDEAKTAATIAESPFYCYTTAADEVTRHWCELTDVKEEWSSGETAEITITIKDI